MWIEEAVQFIESRKFTVSSPCKNNSPPSVDPLGCVSSILRYVHALWIRLLGGGLAALERGTWLVSTLGDLDKRCDVNVL